ncbi:MAG: hypothetical protein PQJ59_15880 [Spirochaetales bacterium]|nr:hypothetical protein [Spirochaetales bacterium]
MEEVRFCAWCGKIVNLKFHYCPWCGKNLFKREEPGVTVNKIVNKMSRLQTNDKLATLEKMENQLGDLEDEISAIIDEQVAKN